MTTEPEGGRKKRAVGGELVLPVAALAFTIYYFSTIWDSPWEAQVEAFLVGTILIGLILIFLIRTAIEIRTGRASLAIGALIEPIWILPKRLAVIAMTVAYTIVLDWLGFTLSSFLFLFITMSILGDAIIAPRRFGIYALVSAVLSLSGYLLFIVAFDTRFPSGVFERLLEGSFAG